MKAFKLLAGLKLVFISFLFITLTTLITLISGCGKDPGYYYGPLPSCDEDKYCVEKYGEGWYCNKDSAVWPTCSEIQK